MKKEIHMKPIKKHIERYLTFCKTQKCLDDKTIKAYKIDLTQFTTIIATQEINHISIEHLESYIAYLHSNYKPKTAKRKIASVKAFYHYLDYKDLISKNPFNKMQIKFREPMILPKTIPLHAMEKILKTVYTLHSNSCTVYQQQKTLRDIAIIELLFSTGIRISELCALKERDINLQNGTILIYGKGNKERQIQIGNDDVIRILKKYHITFIDKIRKSKYFFVNNSGTTVSDQAVRRMIRKYTTLADIDMHITPHMFRHTFATSLLEADVDIRYIQEMLGHSSINITEIYTHVTTAKQKDILRTKHPRKEFCI